MIQFYRDELMFEIVDGRMVTSDLPFVLFSDLVKFIEKPDTYLINFAKEMFDSKERDGNEYKIINSFKHYFSMVFRYGRKSLRDEYDSKPHIQMSIQTYINRSTGSNKKQEGMFFIINHKKYYLLNLSVSYTNFSSSGIINSECLFCLVSEEQMRHRNIQKFNKTYIETNQMSVNLSTDLDCVFSVMHSESVINHKKIHIDGEELYYVYGYAKDTMDYDYSNILQSPFSILSKSDFLKLKMSV